MIVAFMNMKGGVGKTTLCVQLAGAAASRRKRVLIIDYDPQYNATQHLMEPKLYFDLVKKNKTIYDVLQPISDIPSPFEVCISPQEIDPPRVSNMAHTLFRVGSSVPRGQIDLIPGSHKMMYLVLGKTDKSTRPMEERFHKFALGAATQYHFVFIDCHPAGSFLTRSAVAIADTIVAPVVLDSYSHRGVALMNEFVGYIRKFSDCEARLRIVFNMIPWSGRDYACESRIRDSKEFDDLCVESVLHSSGSIAKAGQIGGPSWKRMMQWSGKPWAKRVRQDISNIFDELFPEENNAKG